jgi:hypothetical protein
VIAAPEVMKLLARLSRALDERQKHVLAAEDWYEGRHPIPPPPSHTLAAVDREAREAFDNLSRLGITNFLPPVVDTPARKTRLEGFRFSESGADADAWVIWTRNHMHEDFDLVVHKATETGQAFATVWADSDDRATISIEDPSQTIVAYADGSRHQRVAALKRWIDDDGYVCATLYLPGFIFKFRSVTSSTSTLYVPSSLERPDPKGTQTWQAREVPGEPWPLPNPLGEVPVVEIRQQAPLKAAPYGGGRPFFARQINDQKRINQTVMNMLTTMDHQAFRQRWSIGWPAPTLADGTPDRVALLRAAASGIAAFNHPDGDELNANIRVGEFAQADFRPFIDAVREWVKVIASSSGTPPYAFLMGDMINVAADALARIDGVAKSNVQMLQRAMGGGGREVMRLALKAQSDPRSEDPALAVVWGEPEERTASEQIEVAKAMKDLGAPLEDVFAALPGVDQSTASRWAIEARAEQMLGRARATVDQQQAPQPADAVQ